MQEIKRLGVLSVAKIAALLGIVIGLFAGIIFTLASKYAAGVAPELAAVPFGASSIIVLPLFYGIIYFLSGLIGASIYNLFAKWVGGIKIDLGKDGKKK